MTDRPVVMRAGLTRRILDKVPDRAVPYLNAIAFAALAAALLITLLG